MGERGDPEGMYICKNYSFFDESHWDPFPPWTIEGQRAKWPFDTAASGADALVQTCPVKAFEKYICSVDLELLNQSRWINILVGNDGDLWFIGTGKHHIEFIKQPTGGTTVSVVVGATPLGPSSMFVDNLKVFGIPSNFSMWDSWFNGGWGTLNTMRFEQTANIDGDITYRGCNKQDGTRCNFRVTP